MESDRDFYKIGKCPAIYLYFCLSSCAEIIGHGYLDKFKEKNENIDYPVVNLVHLHDSFKADAINLIAKVLFKIKDLCEKKGLFRPDLVENDLSRKTHEHYLKLIAQIEVFGRLVRCPSELVIDAEGKISISFASDETRKVIKSIYLILRRGKPFSVDIEHEPYNKETRSFGGAAAT